MARSDGWIGARFKSAIMKADRNKTGLIETDDYCHVCEFCNQHYANKNPHPPAMCTGHEAWSGRPCTSIEFQTYRNIDVEAMPIGRILTDYRKRGERGW